MGGGGSNQQTQTTTRNVSPGLNRAYNAVGDVAENMAQGLDYLPGTLQDTTVQQVAGPTDIELQAQQNAQNMLTGPGPQAWDDASQAYAQGAGYTGQAAGMGAFKSQDYNREGDIRDIESFDMNDWMSKVGRGGGGGGGSVSSTTLSSRTCVTFTYFLLESFRYVTPFVLVLVNVVPFCRFGPTS